MAGLPFARVSWRLFRLAILGHSRDWRTNGMAANAELRIVGQAVGLNALSTVGLAIDRLLIGSERLSFVRGNRGTDSTTSGFLIPVDFAGDSSASYLVIWKVNADHGRGRVP